VIVLKGGKPVVALGSLDGASVTAVLQLLGERLDRGKSLPEAIAMPPLSQRNTVVAACARFVSAGGSVERQ
jgi:gamma-glutamyltranspeptidase/glutathione hydrolase